MSATLLIGYDMDARATTGCVVKMIFLLTHTWLRTLKKLLETFRTLKNLFLISHDSMDKEKKNVSKSTAILIEI